MAKVIFGSPGLGTSSIGFDDDRLLTEFLAKVHAGFQSEARGCWVDFGQTTTGDGEDDGYGIQWVPASMPIRFTFDHGLDGAVDLGNTIDLI